MAAYCSMFLPTATRIDAPSALASSHASRPASSKPAGRTPVFTPLHKQSASVNRALVPAQSANRALLPGESVNWSSFLGVPSSAGHKSFFGELSSGLNLQKDALAGQVLRSGGAVPGRMVQGARAAAEVALGEPATTSQAVSEVTIHYYRKDGKYDGWGLHLWGGAASPTAWEAPLPPTGEDSFGAFWSVPLSGEGASVDFLVHSGESKDVTGAVDGSNTAAIWLVAGRPDIFTQEPDLNSLPQGNLGLAKAFWVNAITLAWRHAEEDGVGRYTLHSSYSAALTLDGSGVQGANAAFPLEVDPAGLPLHVTEKFPHIKGYTALRLPADVGDVARLLKGQLAVSAEAHDGAPLDATGVQIPGVLDDLFAFDGPLGASCVENDYVSLSLWAPTAQAVSVVLFDKPSGDDPVERLPMQESSGVWSINGPASWNGKYYLLSANGKRSYLIDLRDPALAPPGWESLQHEKPPLAAFNDISIYELHIRDFSASDKTCDESVAGGYLAFAQQESNGAKHLKSLAKAGLTHIHLLPAFDFSTVDEHKDTWKTVDEQHLATLPPDSEEQQAAIVAIQEEDAFNWGYDPVNWGVPDGSYASNPDGPERTTEFRTMVQAINKMGLRVVLDVVYNHTHGSGPSGSGSVLDKIVPGYYLRRNVDGEIENSTCMNNTASEHYMMDRIIIDDLLMWAREYKVDGFRFDLMGHIMKSTMGWDFGEIAKNQRGVNASQLNLYGSGIGSFNDRIRDTAMGGSPFGDPQQQGFLTGLLLQAQSLAAQTDWIRVGLTGNLRDYVFTSHEGAEVKGGEVKTHDGVSVGYTAAPTEVVNYVSAHDNETLFDVIMVKRCRINHVATSIVALSQSLDRDSYNSGDWFNKLDFTYESNNYGVGLPPKGKNGEKWPIMKELLADPSLKPSSAEIVAARHNLQELLEMRYSTPLFRLPTANAARLRFLNTGPAGVPGVIVMSIEDGDEGKPGLQQLDAKFRRVVVVINARPESASLYTPSLRGIPLSLHPVQASGHDKVVKGASFDDNSAALQVPARTTAVFVELR
eukprot:jgi/Mesen1/6516/ME000332S05521